MSARRERLRGPLVAMGTVALLAVVALAAEGVARRVDPHWRDRAGVRPASFDAPCFRIENGALVRNARVDDAVAVTMPLARTPGRPRIAIVGESSAALRGDRLLRALGAGDCAGRFEVLACGVHGAPHEVMQHRFDEVLRYQPDVVVVRFGHNYRYKWEPISPARLALLGVRRHSALVAMVGGVIDRTAGNSRPPPSRPVHESAPWPGLDRETSERLAETERAIDDVAARGARAGVRVVVSTMGSNVLLPPSQMPSDEADPVLCEARWTRAAHGNEIAANLLADRIARDARAPASWSFEQGVWLDLAGRPGEAAVAFDRALARDALVPRAPARFNDFVRDGARDGRFVLDDTAARVAARSVHALPAWDSYADCCHLYGESDAVDLTAMLDTVRALLPSHGPSCTVESRRFGVRIDWGSVLETAREKVGRVPPEPDAWNWQRGLAEALRRTYDASSDENGNEIETVTLAFLAGNRFATSPPELRVALLTALALGADEAGHRTFARALNERARAVTPARTTARAWVQLALWSREGGSLDEARAHLARALALDPGDPVARRYRALADAEAGLTAGSVRP